MQQLSCPQYKIKALDSLVPRPSSYLPVRKVKEKKNGRGGYGEVDTEGLDGL